MMPSLFSFRDFLNTVYVCEKTELPPFVWTDATPHRTMPEIVQYTIHVGIILFTNIIIFKHCVVVIR